MAVKFPAYIRTYGPSKYEHDIENYIECLERHYKVQLRGRPACEKTVNSLKTALKDCKRQLRDARRRKGMIIQKLLHENTWEPPFERLKRKIQDGFPVVPDLRLRVMSSSSPLTPTLSPETMSPSPGTTLTESSQSSPVTGIAVQHPNTAIHSPDDFKHVTSVHKGVMTMSPVFSDPCPLPQVITTNIHLLLSPIQSFENIKCVNPPKDLIDELEVSNAKEWELFEKDTCVRVKFGRGSDLKGTFRFSLINACGTILLIDYRGLTDTSFFKSGGMKPRRLIRLVPGLSQPYTFTFTLQDTVDAEEISSSLFFKVAKKPRYDSGPLGPFHALLIPMSKFQKGRSVTVSESVYIPPAYSWHLTEKNGYPFGIIQIASNDIRSYDVEIAQCILNVDEETSSVSVQVNSPTASDSPTGSTKKGKKTQSKQKQAKSPLRELVSAIVEEIVDNSLEPFLLQQTYVHVPAHSKRYVRVYFTKALHVGDHQAAYEFKFFDELNHKLKFIKKAIIYAEALPVPIVINPPSILDLTNTPLHHGYCEAYFTNTNTHNLYGCMISFRLTTKLQKLITIDPMEVEIPRKSTIHFRVRFCTRDFIRQSAADAPVEFFVHFNVKITATGMAVVYSDFPPIYYEIIAPCVIDYSTVYKHHLTVQNLQ